MAEDDWVSSPSLLNVDAVATIEGGVGPADSDVRDSNQTVTGEQLGSGHLPHLHRAGPRNQDCVHLSTRSKRIRAVSACPSIISALELAATPGATSRRPPRVPFWEVPCS